MHLKASSLLGIDHVDNDVTTLWFIRALSHALTYIHTLFKVS